MLLVRIAEHGFQFRPVLLPAVGPIVVAHQRLGRGEFLRVKGKHHHAGGKSRHRLKLGISHVPGLDESGVNADPQRRVLVQQRSADTHNMHDGEEAGLLVIGLGLSGRVVEQTPHLGISFREGRQHLRRNYRVELAAQQKFIQSCPVGDRLDVNLFR